MSTTTETTTETGACFNSKHPHTTLWLEIKFLVGERPQELIDELAAIGFAEDGLAKAPPCDGVDEVQLAKPGSALFGGWTAEEKKANLKAARAVLKRHGFVNVPCNKLSWVDML
jgi:hypothetical protein